MKDIKDVVVSFRVTKNDFLKLKAMSDMMQYDSITDYVKGAVFERLNNDSAAIAENVYKDPDSEDDI